VKLPFGRRLLAFVADCVLLGAILAALAFPLHDAYARLGPWGRLAGGAVAIGYFGAMRSRTLGKRLLRLEIRRRDGSPVSYRESFLRATVLMVPIALNGFAAGMQNEAYVALLTWFVAAAGSATLYLFLFNRRTRQALHDLAAGTVVVRSGAPPPSLGIWPRHFTVLGALVAAELVLVVVAALRPDANSESRDVRRKIMTMAATPLVSVERGRTDEESYVAISAMTYLEPDDPDDLARGIAAVTLRDYPAANEVETLVIRIETGYDLLFAKSTDWHTYSDSPIAWRQQLDATTAASP
jgi:uncharacterized RDD family membrane protein YckC